MNIILTGFMGAGKSTASRFLSFFYNCYDLDKVIERVSKYRISEIFEKKGEAFFREIEKDIFNKLLDFDKIIIAAGGGTLQYYPDLKKLKNNSKIIFLYSPFNILLDRVKNTERPLTKDIKKLESLYFERLPHYLKNADLIVCSDSKGWENKIIKYLKIIGFNCEKDIEVDKIINRLFEGFKND